MKVFFANRSLEQCFEDYNQAERNWGIAVARKYIQRIQWILNATDFNSLRTIRSFRLHALSGPMAGRFAIDLNRRWRIILTYDPTDESVNIMEVTNHYGD